MAQAKADWYPDPRNPHQFRYWNGEQWTDHVAPRSVQASPSQPAPAQPPAAHPEPPTAAPAKAKVPMFGARNVARQQAEELEQLRAEMSRLGLLDAAELQAHTASLQQDVARLQGEYAEQRAQLEAELAELRQRVAVTQEEDVR